MSWPDPTLNPGPLTVLVVVSIDENGKLTDARILQSSGYEIFDAEALSTAEASTYAPGTNGCTPIAARYIFNARFDYGAGARSADPFHSPSFTPPQDWQPSAAPSPDLPLPSFDLDLAALGRKLAAWKRGDERLGLAEFIEVSPRQLSDAFGLLMNDIGHPQAAGKAAALCGGKTPAWEAEFNANEDTRAMLFVMQDGDALYSLVYTVPTGGEFDAATLKSIESLCAFTPPAAA